MKVYVCDVCMLVLENLKLAFLISYIHARVTWTR